MKMQTGVHPDEMDVLNIELGAGCGDFGKRFFSKCYLTDKNEEYKTLCPVCYIDWFCDAHALPWGDDRFEKVIICNPFGYGFKNQETTDKLLDEVIRVLKTQGELLVLGGGTNKFFKLKKLENFLDTFFSKKIENVTYNYNLVEFSGEELEKKYPNFTFKQTNNNIPTKVTHEVSIKIEKQ